MTQHNQAWCYIVVNSPVNIYFQTNYYYFLFQTWKTGAILIRYLPHSWTSLLFQCFRQANWFYSHKNCVIFSTVKCTNGRTVIASLQIGEHPLLNIPTQVKPHSVDLSLKNVAAAQAASSSDFWKNVAATPNFGGEELWWRALSVWFIDNACFNQGNHDLWCQNAKNVYIGSFFGTRLLISWKICKFLKRWIDGGIVKRSMILENIDSISNDIWWRPDIQLTENLSMYYTKD